MRIVAREQQENNSSGGRGTPQEKLLRWVYVLGTTQARKSKAHITNRLWAQVRPSPSVSFLARTNMFINSKGKRQPRGRDLNIYPRKQKHPKREGGDVHAWFFTQCKSKPKMQFCGQEYGKPKGMRTKNQSLHSFWLIT